MGISIHLKIIAIFLVASLCLNNFAVLGQQNRGCGREYDSSDYVASTSSQVQIHEHPWMVAIVKKIEPDVAHCSASLVAPKFIITAGHCFNDKPKEAFEVVLGSDYLSQLPFNIQTYQKRMNIAKLHIHPNYIKEGKYHDFAIIELNEEVTYSKGIFPICLPQTETTPEHILSLSGDFVDLVGFGKTGLNDGKKNQKLRFASIKIYSQLHCNTEYQKEINEANVFNSSILCAGSRIKGVGSCGGDSGGPLMKFNDFGQYFEQIALTKGYGNCGIYPGMYTRIGDPTNFRWMQSVIFGKSTLTTTESTTIAEEVGTKILIATGFQPDDGRNTEVIDLEDSNFSCTKVEQFPIKLYGATGGLMNGQKPFICGGYGNINGDWASSKDCYQLTGAGSWAKDQTAKLNTAREDAGFGSVVIDNNLFLAGGYNENRLASIEMLSPDAPAQSLSVQLPTALNKHCQVPWDSDTFFIIGGDYGSKRDESHFINVKTNRRTNGPSLNTARSGHACGEMDVNGKSYIIVTGGLLRSTEVLDKNNVEQGWQKGDDFDFPVSKYDFQMVSSPDKKTLYAIGGIGPGSSNKDIYKSDCNSDIKSCKWIKSNTELKYGRDDFVAIPIPNSLADKLCK